MFQTYPSQMVSFPGMQQSGPNPHADGLPANRGGACGDRIDDYILGQEICEGSYGIVRHATKVDEPGKRFAIKVVKKVRYSDDEVDLQTSMEHTNIVKVLKSFTMNDVQYIVLEYCGGGDLFEFVNRKRVLDEATVAKYFKQMLAAVEVLHRRKVAHHDVKLENFLLTDDLQTVKLCDFGAAESLPETPLTTRYKGELSAPEKKQGAQYNAFVADVYQLGKSLHELAFGLRQPNASGSINPPPHACPSASLFDLLHGMLQTDPSKRPSLAAVQGHHWMGATSGNNDNVHQFSVGRAQGPPQQGPSEPRQQQQHAPTFTQMPQTRVQQGPTSPTLYSIPDRTPYSITYSPQPQYQFSGGIVHQQQPHQLQTHQHHQQGVPQTMQTVTTAPTTTYYRQPQFGQQMAPTYTVPQTTHVQQGMSTTRSLPSTMPSTAQTFDTMTGAVPVPTYKQTTQQQAPTLTNSRTNSYNLTPLQIQPYNQTMTVSMNSPMSNQSGVVWTPVASNSPSSSPCMAPMSPTFSGGYF